MKTIIIVQARMGSKRLPGKVLMKISGKEILQYLIDFLKLCKLPDQIIVATTVLPEDDKICELASKNNIEYFRGSPNDVLERYYECAKKFDGDIIVRMTSDDPLIDPRIIDEVINKCKDRNYDYVSNSIPQTYPYGYSSCEALPFSLLKKLHETQKDSESREHVTYYIRNNSSQFHMANVETSHELDRSAWRLTIDYPEDFQLVSKILSNLYHENQFIKYKSLVEFLDKNKHLQDINKKYT